MTLVASSRNKFLGDASEFRPVSNEALEAHRRQRAEEAEAEERAKTAEDRKASDPKPRPAA